MGQYSSTPKDRLSALKDQVSRLGDRNPFGDDEILRISRCMAYLTSIYAGNSNAQLKSNNYLATSTGKFLTDWAIFCSTLPAADFSSASNEEPYVDLLCADPRLFIKSSYSANSITQQSRIKHIMGIIEENVLPPNFGRTLHECFFTLLKPNASLDCDDGIRRIAWERLQKFMDGLSETSRRGSRKALTCIYKCCASDGDTSQKASAEKLLDLTYRMALASSIYKEYFQNQNDMEEQKERFRLRDIKRDAKIRLKELNNTDIGEDEEEEEEEEEIEEEVIPPFDPSTMFPQDIGNSLTGSLVAYASKYSNQSSSVQYQSSYNNFANNTAVTNETNDGSNENNDSDKVSLDTFLAWSESTAPCLSSTLETFVHVIMFPDIPYPPSRSEFIFPSLRNKHSAFVPKRHNSQSSPLLFTFASFSTSLGSNWHRLYTSDSDGLSFNRLQNSLLGYGGPTLIIIKEAESQGTFGAYTSTAWKESKDFYGNSDCFLYAIQPVVKVMRPKGGSGSNYMYCNPESRSRGYDGLEHGIGFGGSTDKLRLFISESFEGCMAGASDLTFEPGSLLPPREVGNPSPSKYFDLESLEVWGVGGDAITNSALDARHKKREVVASNIRKARKVDKAAFLDDFRSGLIESKAFKHRGEMRGRGDCHIDDEDSKNYVYAK